MKKYTAIIFPLIITVCIAIVGFSLNDDSGNIPDIKQGNIISKLISEVKSKTYFDEFHLFKNSNKTSLSRLDEFVSRADIFELDHAVLSKIYNTAPAGFVLHINSRLFGTIEVELMRVHNAPEEMQIRLINGSNISYQTFRPGLAYEGIIKGDNNSIASITINEGSVMGLICSDKGNFVLGARKDEQNRLTDDYIFYNDKDLKIENNFKCGVDDYAPIHQKGIALKPALPSGVTQSDARNDSLIRVYFVADYQMYLDNGSNVNATGQFISSVFNNTATIYRNEGIPTTLAPTISVYTSPDPYAPLNDGYAILNLFGQNTQDNFNGDLAHLLSTGHNGTLGGIAWINVLCQPYLYFPPPDDAHYGRYAFSNIADEFFPYPTFSWTVMVITHEMGHNIASKHTHACVWPTISRQIDSCYQSEGGCVTGTQQNNNGTVMSYCHLNGAINLVNGFGPLPGDTVRLGYALAHCIDTTVFSSEFPKEYNLLQNYPNPFNPGTTIKFGLPEEGYVTIKVYDLTGEEITTLLQNRYYSTGSFTSYFDASAFDLASGVYFYRIDVSRNNKSIFSNVKKMVLIK